MNSIKKKLYYEITAYVTYAVIFTSLIFIEIVPLWMGLLILVVWLFLTAYLSVILVCRDLRLRLMPVFASTVSDTDIHPYHIKFPDLMPLETEERAVPTYSVDLINACRERLKGMDVGLNDTMIGVAKGILISRRILTNIILISYAIQLFNVTLLPLFGIAFLLWMTINTFHALVQRFVFQPIHQDINAQVRTCRGYIEPYTDNHKMVSLKDEPLSFTDKNT